MALFTVGLKTHTWNTQIKSIIMLLVLPYVLLFTIWGFFSAWAYVEPASVLEFMRIDRPTTPFYVGLEASKRYWLYAIGFVVSWYIIAFVYHTKITQNITHGRLASRSEFPKLFDILEALCISRGLAMPSLYVIDTKAMNAFTTGMSEASYTITVTTGLIHYLSEEELEAVLAHELTHIINDDVLLSMIAVVVTGFFSLSTNVTFRSLRYMRHIKDTRAGAAFIVGIFPLALLFMAIGWLVSSLVKFAFSRKREFLADAGAVSLTKNPSALAKALKKVSFAPKLEEVPSDFSGLCIVGFKQGFSWFATHPPIESRIHALVEIGADEITPDMEKIYLDYPLPSQHEVKKRNKAILESSFWQGMRHDSKY